MAWATARCGCEISAEIAGGCFGGHFDGDYCECPSPYLVDAEIEVPCAAHGGDE